jgi:hypothetical protein
MLLHYGLYLAYLLICARTWLAANLVDCFREMNEHRVLIAKYGLGQTPGSQDVRSTVSRR